MPPNNLEMHDGVSQPPPEASGTEGREDLCSLQMNGRLSSLLLPSQRFSLVSNQRQKCLKRKKEALWSRVLLCTIPEHNGVPSPKEGLLGTDSVQQVVIIKIIYTIILVGRDFPHLCLPLKLAKLEMKTMASLLPLEKQGKRKDILLLLEEILKKLKRMFIFP